MHALRAELEAAAAAFATDDEHLQRILQTLAADVDRARAERLPIFPVIHHSPASAAHVVRYLREHQPKLVFIELCEDLLGSVADLANCTLPVALQAFAGEVQGHPECWAPLTVVAPITELSAEYQAIAYALRTEGVALVFVDRSVDHVFQWRDPALDPDAPVHDDEDDAEQARLHGEAVGVEVGAVLPSFPEFRDVLLANARMSHLEEWLDLYVEEPTIGADTATYREVMFLVGSLFRRLGSTPHAREEIRRRDRYMWTRIKEALDRTCIKPEDAVFLCGAAHAVCDEVPEWGVDSAARYEISAPTGTPWRYGLIPSSYGAIELQFGHARGAVSMAEQRWKKAVTTWKIEPYSLSARPGKVKRSPTPPPAQLQLAAVLSRPPALQPADAEELASWCLRITAEARKNRYLASTADAIAIYETSILLARLRSRLRPSPYDFIDAAETCLEKSRVPGRRTIRQLCARLLGGDRVGQVGYEAVPPLVQQIYDRLAAVGITAQTRRVTRVLLDLDAHPELRPVSRLLWQLRSMLPGGRVARPIMGKLELGHTARQESWDVTLHGAEQRAVIQLSFEGVTVAQVLEQRLRATAWGPTATTRATLEAVEAALTLLDTHRLATTLGERAVELLAQERGPDDAPAIFGLIRRFVHHFRAEGALPAWLERFVATGYAHYTTQLPEAFRDRGTAPDQVTAMLSFVFTLESLALAMGCSRSQVRIALEQAATVTVDPDKLGLLWAAEWLAQLSDEDGVRQRFEAVLHHPLGRGAFPRYLSGLLLALGFAPRVAPLAVAMIGRAFAELPDHVLLPWMPGLLTSLSGRRDDALPGLFREALKDLPRTLGATDGWTPHWAGEQAAPVVSAVVARSAGEEAAHAALRRWPAALDGWATAIGAKGGWAEVAEVVASDGRAAAASGLVARYPEAGLAWGGVIAVGHRKNR